MEHIPSAFSMVLLQWTLLLALGWTLHAVLGRGHPRWRLILWRSILLFTLLLPLASLLRVPRLELREPGFVSEAPLPTPRIEPDPPAQAQGTPVAPISEPLAGSVAPATGATVTDEQRVPAIGWGTIAVVFWIAGAGWALLRLFLAHVRLRRIINEASSAPTSVQLVAEQVRCELGVRRKVHVGVSHEIAAPFLCGVRQPVILLPSGMEHDLPQSELAALLTHEMAHECRRDVAWCIAWQVMRALAWFHPLVWAVPAAHVIACEEEADRMAANRLYDDNEYRQVLAQLALRVLGRPAAEVPLALNATSHLARRLSKLARADALRWRSVHSLAAFAMAGGLLVISAGWHFAQETAQPVSLSYVATGTVTVVVQDDTGRPVEGAVILPTGLRARGERLRGSSYAWVPERHGPARQAVTGHDGRARVTFPLLVVPAEKLQTGEISFTVDHSDFAKVWTNSHPVDGTAEPVRLGRGIPVRVTAHFGPARQRVAEIIPHLIGERVVGPKEWQRDRTGSHVYRRLSPRKHFLYVAGRLPTGEIGYSHGVVFFGEQRDEHDFALELKPGTRVEGRIDSKVPRPVQNGWVQLSVHSDDANTSDTRIPLRRSLGNTGFWWSYRPIGPDGTFVFESVPPGEIKVIAYGEGFVSANGPSEEPPLPPGIPAQPPRRVTRAVPQSFPAIYPVTTVEVASEPTVILQVKATSEGKPVADARVYVSPNVIHMPTGSRLFGAGEISSEAPFRQFGSLPAPSYSADTDVKGIAVLRNVPAFTSTLGVMHRDFEVPLREVNAPGVPARFQPPANRYLDLNLEPGVAADIEIVLQPRGREFIGTHP